MRNAHLNDDRVYPRVGGETLAAMPSITTRTGLSPRGRGNPTALRRAGPPYGSIPAWAGKPCGSAPPSWCARVYPRVGGETPGSRRSISPLSGLSPRGRGTYIDAGVTQFAYGLSPRGRGNLPGADGSEDRTRSIPAWAGKPGSCSGMRSRIGVYPRVGGETGPAMPSTPGGRGLSPRGRGNLWFLVRTPGKERSIPAWAGKPWWRGCRAGLSPRGRGNLEDGESAVGRRRSIPAWAGKPYHSRPSLRQRRVYPRVGGETGGGRSVAGNAGGLSPRGRGNRAGGRSRPGVQRSIPAWAGKPSTCLNTCSSSAVYPRVGGETISRMQRQKLLRGLSPRGRGNHLKTTRGAEVTGSIPAWAGKPTMGADDALRDQVYPRVGGETVDL